MTEGYDSDPRLKEPSRYDQNQVIAAITDFCNYLTTLPFIEKEQLFFPPEGGWPNITKESMAPLGKTDEVVELLKRLPYFDLTGDQPESEFRSEPHKAWCKFWYCTYMLDFHGEQLQAALRKGGDLSQVPHFVPPFIDLPPWTISLTTAILNGHFLILDTTDGTITKYETPSSIIEQMYAADDSRHWRNECNDETKPVREWFLDMMEDFRELRVMGFPVRPGKHEAPTSVIVAHSFQKEPQVEEVKRIYLEYGWPYDFRREDCKRALIAMDPGY